MTPCHSVNIGEHRKNHGLETINGRVDAMNAPETSSQPVAVLFQSVMGCGSINTVVELVRLINDGEAHWAREGSFALYTHPDCPPCILCAVNNETMFSSGPEIQKNTSSLRSLPA